MMITIDKQDILGLIDGEILTERMADAIVDSKKNDWLEFEPVFIKAVDEAAKVAIVELIDEYDFKNDIKNWLTQALTKMNKQELFALLLEKDEK